MAVPYQTLESITRDYIVPEIVDQLKTKSPVIQRIMKRKKNLPGGMQIDQPVQYAYNTDSGAWKGGYAVMPFSSPEFVTKAVHQWSYYQCPVVWAETDLLKNMGEPQVVDYAEALVENGIDSIMNTFTLDLFKDGSNNSVGAKTLDGFSAIITYNADPAPSAYGGISRVSSTGTKQSFTNNAYWNGQSVAVNAGAVTRWLGSFNFSNASTVIDMRKLNQMFLLLPETPDLFVCSLPVFGRIWDMNNANEKIERGMTAVKGDSYDVGARFIMINGVPCVPDTYIDDPTKIYALNFNYMFLRTATDFEQSEPRTPTRQRVVGRYIFWDGQLTCSSPQKQGVITGATAQ